MRIYRIGTKSLNRTGLATPGTLADILSRAIDDAFVADLIKYLNKEVASVAFHA